MASAVKGHQKNRLRELPSVFNEDSTGLEVFVATVIKEKLEKGVSKKEILEHLKMIEPNEANAKKCEQVVKELLGENVKFDVRDYYDWDLKQWKSKTADVGSFEDFFS